MKIRATVSYLPGVISLLYNVCCKKKSKLSKNKKGDRTEEKKILSLSSPEANQANLITETDLEARVRRQRALIEEMQG